MGPDALETVLFIVMFLFMALSAAGGAWVSADDRTKVMDRFPRYRIIYWVAWFGQIIALALLVLRRFGSGAAGG